MSDQPCKISLIVAVAENGVIGRDNAIPWKCSSDMKYFRKTTMGKPVIMGRKTWESLGKPLKGRENIILTRNKAYKAQGAHIVSSASEALQLAGTSGDQQGLCEVMIIGGKAIYDVFIGSAQRLHYTLIHMQPEGDIFFETLADLTRAGWRECSREFCRAGERDEADMSFIVLER